MKLYLLFFLMALVSCGERKSSIKHQEGSVAVSEGLDLIDFKHHTGVYAISFGLPQDLLFPYQYDCSLDGGSHKFVYHIDGNGNVIDAYLFRWSDFDRRDGVNREFMKERTLSLLRLDFSSSKGRLLRLSPFKANEVISKIESTLKELLSEEIFMSYHEKEYPFSEESEVDQEIVIDMDETPEEKRASDEKFAHHLNHSNAYMIIQLIKEYRSQ